MLKRPGKAVRSLLADMVERAADAVEAIVVDGVDVAMNRFNALPDDDGAGDDPAGAAER